MKINFRSTGVNKRLKRFNNGVSKHDSIWERSSLLNLLDFLEESLFSRETEYNVFVDWEYVLSLLGGAFIWNTLESVNCCNSIVIELIHALGLEVNANSFNWGNEFFSIDNASREIVEGELRDMKVNVDSTRVNKSLEWFDNCVGEDDSLFEGDVLSDFLNLFVEVFFVVEATNDVRVDGE